MRTMIAATMLVVLATSCQETPKPAIAPEKKAMQPMNETVDSSLKTLVYASKKDPSCGMPLKAGLIDTTTYKGKLYGFCSKECKDDFLKDPAAHLAGLKE